MQRHLVLLGASNLTRSFPYIVSLAIDGFDETLSVFATKGFGRSYGRESGFLGKKFPGIFFSEIWGALESAKPAPISAVITDIGNDLGYEVPVDELLEWLIGCVDRLQQLGAEVVITDIPIDSIQRVSEARFRFFRTLLFPFCRVSKQVLVQRAKSLRTGLHQLAETRNITIFPVQKEWYGFDPIHPGKRCLRQMWREIFSDFDGFQLPDPETNNSWLMSTYLRLLNVEKRSFFTAKTHADQPRGQLVDGTSIFLY